MIQLKLNHFKELFWLIQWIQLLSAFPDEVHCPSHFFDVKNETLLIFI